jgi:hypothetical protein
MAAPAHTPVPRALRITVYQDDNNGQKNGTFTGPPPKMRVDLNDTMKWDLDVVPADKNATFEINFDGFSWPFAGSPAPITGGTGALQAVNEGLYHYAVKVTTSAGTVFRIDQCPEAQVGG